jgi:hypothetical protein
MMLRVNEIRSRREMIALRIGVSLILEENG